MKKIINGFRYDTDKAIAIGTGGKGCYPGDGDFSSWEATLYKTPRVGRFFIAGQGGAMTRFAESHGGTSWGSERLIPMNTEEALEWAEQYLDPDDIEEHFGDMIEDA